MLPGYTKTVVVYEVLLRRCRERKREKERERERKVETVKRRRGEGKERRASVVASVTLPGDAS